mmetsp:Transcript_38598/g.87771  ORF Transcript_38598/g.87771 Transcript_38598/m.87771 type:complete len:148 (-) Transcript_38598:85-528(-)
MRPRQLMWAAPLLILAGSLTATAALAAAEHAEADETAFIQMQVQVDTKEKRLQKAISVNAVEAKAVQSSHMLHKVQDLAGAVHGVLTRSPGSFVHSGLSMKAPTHKVNLAEHQAPLMRHLTTRPWEVRAAAKLVAKTLFGPSTKDHL